MNRNCTFCLVGLGLGSLTGILFAPRTGASTRARLAKRARKAERLVQQRVASVSATLNRAVGRGVAEMVRTAKSTRIPSSRALAQFR